MAATNLGRIFWSANRTVEGHREYIIRFRVKTGVNDGPQIASLASGLPNIGDPWTYGSDNDQWAFCTPEQSITQQVDDEGEWIPYWIIESKFSTKLSNIPGGRCNSVNIDNPLLEPMKISGSYIGGTILTTRDRFGELIRTTSFEPIEVEFDNNLPTVIIEQNVLALGLNDFGAKVNTVNDSTLWGLSAGKVKLSNVTWERKVYGVCNYYFTRVLQFDVNFNTFARSDVPNRGRRLIRGQWDANGTTYTAAAGVDPDDPRDYIEGLDKNGYPAEQYLNADGTPSATVQYLPPVGYYNTANFLTLGIPTSLSS